MDSNRDIVSPAPRQRRKDPFSFHPWRAALGAAVGLFAGMVLCAAMNQWWWLLLAPATALLLAFDFWWMLLQDEDGIPSGPPIEWPHYHDGSD
jgi:hypothetical protein